MSETKLGTIGLIHGAGHRAAHWDKLRPELEARGFDTIAVDLPVDDPDATFADYAQVAAEAFKPAVENGGRIDLVPHSMGSQTIPCLVGILGEDAVRNVIHISGSIGESGIRTTDAFVPTVVPKIPKQRNTEDYRQATLRLADGRTTINPAEIRKLMFSDCSPQDFIEALELMRLQGKPLDEPPLEAYKLAGVAQTYILGDADPIRNKDYVTEKIVGELGMKLVTMPGGHSPAIARPAELADVIASEIRYGLSSEDTAPLPLARAL